MDNSARAATETLWYIVSLQETIICACIEDELPKARKRGIKPDNPRNIAPNIATVPAPPTSELPGSCQALYSIYKDLTVSLTLVTNVTERSKVGTGNQRVI